MFNNESPSLATGSGQWLNTQAIVRKWFCTQAMGESDAYPCLHVMCLSGPKKGKALLLSLQKSEQTAVISLNNIYQANPEHFMQVEVSCNMFFTQQKRVARPSLLPHLHMASGTKRQSTWSTSVHGAGCDGANSEVLRRLHIFTLPTYIPAKNHGRWMHVLWFGRMSASLQAKAGENPRARQEITCD